jgi:hypothetical protein
MAPAFVIANQGFDVWLGNSRGNKYSREHATKSPDSKDFWDFSWPQMVYLTQKIPFIVRIRSASRFRLHCLKYRLTKNRLCWPFLGDFDIVHSLVPE